MQKSKTREMAAILSARSNFNLINSCRKIIGLVKNFKIPGEKVDSYPSHPILFLKPPTTLIAEGGNIVTPLGYNPITYEVELGEVIRKTARNIHEEEVLDHKWSAD